jgi:signal transduction histidine kinase
VFARHNLTKDPPFSRLDLISCRNVLIYMGPVLQDRIIPTFHYALRPGGFLLLGSSETVSAHPDMFSLVHKKRKIYARKGAGSRVPMDFAVEPSPENAPPARKPQAWTEVDLQREADRIVLHRYGPPGVVVDDDMNILHFRGHTSPFLEPASGAASLNLLRMLKEGLSVEVKNAVAKARQQSQPVRREGLRVRGDTVRAVNIEVMPFKRTAGQRKYLVLFEPVQIRQQVPPAKDKSPARVSALEEQNEHLRQELAGTKEYLQSIIEDQEAAHEELRSAAEEIQSSNEELQSTNEELETAKEELQSTNEELNTVNEELQHRNIQLAQVGNDLVNLLANVNIPILILDEDFRIRRFTPVTERALNLISSDVGRPIRDINLRITVPEMEPLLRDVIESLVPKVVDVFDREGRRYSLRVRPYRTEDNRINGVVMVFVDMDMARLETSEDLPVGAVASDQSWGNGKSRRNKQIIPRASLLFAQEEERRRLSHELHDELNQRLALLEVSLQSLENRTEQPEDLRTHLQVLRKNVADLSDDLRRIAYRLHPSMLDDLGLVAAVESFCEEFSAREKIQVRFTEKYVPENIPAPVALTLYRIMQEGLRNVAKHSRAKRATVTLAGEDSRVILAIRDAGAGFDPAVERLKGGLGIRGMQERMELLGGELTIRSAPGRGTELTATARLDAAPQKEKTKE